MTVPDTGIEVNGPRRAGYEVILTDEALAFVAELARSHVARVDELLARRAERQEAFDQGERPGFLPETQAIRGGDWTVAPLPADL